MGLEVIWYEALDWIHVIQNIVHWRTLLNTVVTVRDGRLILNYN